MLLFGIQFYASYHKRDWIRYWLMTTCFTICTLHIVYSVVRLFGCSFIRLFVYSAVRLCVSIFSFIRVRLFGNSCSFVRLFVSAVQLGVVLTVLLLHHYTMHFISFLMCKCYTTNLQCWGGPVAVLHTKTSPIYSFRIPRGRVC